MVHASNFALGIDVLNLHNNITKSGSRETRSVADRSIGSSKCHLNHDNVKWYAILLVVEAPLPEVVVDSASPDLEKCVAGGWLTAVTHRLDGASNAFEVTFPVLGSVEGQINETFVWLQHDEHVSISSEDIPARKRKLRMTTQER